MCIKKVQIQPYDPKWSEKFKEIACDLKNALGGLCREVHHVGSTSIPGLAAKEDLDIVCVVTGLQDSVALLEFIGYVFKGEFNIPMRFFFSHNNEHRKINLHVVEEDHPFLELQLKFRDYLRMHPEDRMAYQNLKLTLIQDPKNFEKKEGRFVNYTLRKNEFIKEVLRKSGFDRVMVNFCMHDAEWDAYHRLLPGKPDALSSTIGFFTGRT